MKWINKKYGFFIGFLMAINLILCSEKDLVAQNKYALPLQNELQSEKKKSYELFVKGDNEKLSTFFRSNKIKLKYKSADYFALHISSEMLIELTKMDFVTQIIWSNDKGTLLNDHMLSNANVLGLKQIGIYDSLLDGRGVIMGFVDSGLDYTHPDFIKDDGTSRILYFWDQKDPADSSNIFQDYGYGRLIPKDTLDTWIENNIEEVLDPNSEFGHGTTVVGTACSNGHALQEQVDEGSLENTFEGVVPASDIIMVASDFTKDNWLASIADAVHFMLAKAELEEKPIVINLSVGTYSGSHDANDPVGVIINDWFSDDYQGRFLVCAGGNSRTLRYHLGYSNTDSAYSVFSSFNGPQEYGRMAVFESWIDSISVFENEIGFYNTTSGEILVQKSSNENFESNIDTTLIDSVFDANENMLGIVKRYMTYQGEQIQFQVQVEQIQSTYLDAVLFTYGQHRIDSWSAQWLGSSNIKGPEALNTSVTNNDQYRSPDSLMQTVSSFSCAENVLTVANFKNRLSYVDVNGNIHTFEGELGELAMHSSRGPTRDSRIKPDLAASGEVILSSGPFNYREILLNAAPHKLAQGGWHMRNGGSSMASPIVAGIAAMYLQRCPNTPPSIVHEALLNASYQDIFTGILPNGNWGYGKADGLASLSYSLEAITILESNLNCGQNQVELSIPSDYNSVIWNTGDSLYQICVEEGEYWVWGIDENACLQRSDNIIVNANGIAEHKKELLLYPNPSQGRFVIKGLESGEVEIYNSIGQVVPFKMNAIQNGMKFEISHAFPGIYFVIEKESKKTWELIIKN